MAEQKHKQEQLQEFALASVAELSSTFSSSLPQSSPILARFSAASGVAELRFHRESDAIDGYNVDLGTARVTAFLDAFSYCLFD